MNTSEVTVEVFDLQGKAYMIKSFGVTIGNNALALYLNGLNSGSYVLKIKSPDGSQIVSVIKN